MSVQDWILSTGLVLLTTYYFHRKSEKNSPLRHQANQIEDELAAIERATIEFWQACSKGEVSNEKYQEITSNLSHLITKINRLFHIKNKAPSGTDIRSFRQACTLDTFSEDRRKIALTSAIRKITKSINNLL